MLPGVNRLDYAGGYWPRNIVSVCNSDICKWLETVLWLVPLPSRPDGYDPLKSKNITTAVVTRLAEASAQAWDALVCVSGSLGLWVSGSLGLCRQIQLIRVTGGGDSEGCGNVVFTSDSGQAISDRLSFPLGATKCTGIGQGQLLICL